MFARGAVLVRLLVRLLLLGLMLVFDLPKFPLLVM